MSIATDEAEQWAQSRYVGSSHIERHDGHAVSVPDYQQKIILRAEGYVAGRTAEPTRVEIEASAKAVYDELCGNIIHGWLDENGDPQMDEDPFRTVFINATVEALTAARKAVTE